MQTGGINFNRAIYTLKESKDNGRILDFKIDDFTQSYNSLFTSNIRLELDNGYHDRSREFDYYLYFRNDTNWLRCKKTGLAFTGIENIYEGNISKEVTLITKNHKGRNFETAQHFVIAQFLNNLNNIVVDIFENFYPNKTILLKHFVKEHQFYK